MDTDMGPDMVPDMDSETTKYMDSYDIVCFMCMIYVTLMISLVTLYLRTMYVQYRDAHDKWHDIERDYDKKD